MNGLNYQICPKISKNDPDVCSKCQKIPLKILKYTQIIHFHIFHFSSGTGDNTGGMTDVGSDTTTTTKAPTTTTSGAGERVAQFGLLVISYLVFVVIF